MATKTVNRQTFSVDYDLDDLNQGMFSMTEFKGICDRENDVTVDQNTFSKAENVYVNENSVLASRAPFKFADGEAYIVNEWYFGQYGLRIYRQVSGTTYTFTIACFTHDTYANDTDKFSTYQFVYSGTDDITLDIPKVTGVQIEDKVFIWFAGQAIIAFNTAGYFDEESSQNLPFFEDAYKYLYIPAHTLVTNGFESELEAQNFLTDAYIKRYLYTTESSVDFESLRGQRLSVYLTNSDGSRRHLYDINSTASSASNDKIIITYPFVVIGNDYKVVVKEAFGIPIILRYIVTGVNTCESIDTGTSSPHLEYTDTIKIQNIQIAYGTNVFHNIDLPNINEDIKYLSLTDDGLYIYAQTYHSLLWCAIVSGNAESSQLNYEFIWERQFLLSSIRTIESATETESWPSDPDRNITKVIFIPKFLSRSTYSYWYQYEEMTGTRLVGYLVVVQNEGATDSYRKEINTTFYEETGDIDETPILRLDYDPYAPKSWGGTGILTRTMNAYRKLTYAATSASVNFQGICIVLNLLNYTGNVSGARTGEEVAYVILIDKEHDKVTYDSTKNTTVLTSGLTLSDGSTVNLTTRNPLSNGYYFIDDIDVRCTIDEGSIYQTEGIIEFDIIIDYIMVWEGVENTSQLVLPTDIWTRETRHLLYNTSSQSFTQNSTVQRKAVYGSAVYRHLFSEGGVLTNAYVYIGNFDEYSSANRIMLPRMNNIAPINYIPYYMIDTNFYIGVGDELYTNQLQSGTIIEIDTYENVTFDDEGNMTINFRPDVPDCFSALGDYYISFATIEDGQFRLLMSDARRDEDTNDFLLYLPDDSEQKFSQRITNLHPLADDTMGIFTEDEIWYIQALNLDNESVTRYTKAIKSKLPVGCHQGNDVITADNGQAILFAVPRGVVYLTPQDFVSTTDRQINYISDAIQNMYNEYYFDSVKNANAHEFGITIPSQIKIMTYSYWICFYRYMDNQILLIDTRSNSWWKWKTPYPILKLNNNGNLTVLMQIEKSKYAEDYSASLGGVSYLYCNLSYYLYQDDVLDDYIDGTYVIQTSAYGERIEYQYASPIIDWTFTTQKLHFGAINNYKYIRAININTNGEGKLVTKYTTTAYRDLYHPEASVTREIKINDLRTYVNRCNLLHVVNFALSLSSEDVLMVEPLSLNSISVKYEIKGQVR